MKGVHYQVAKILRSEDFSLWQKLNSFIGVNQRKNKLQFMVLI